MFTEIPMPDLKTQVMLLVRQGEPLSAAALAQAEVDKNPSSTEALHLLAYAYERASDLDAAIRAASSAIASAPDDPSLLFHRGRLFFKAEAASDALSDMQATLALEERLGSTFYTETAAFIAAEALLRLNRHSEALRICSAVRPDFSIHLGGPLSKAELIRDCERGLQAKD